MSRLAEALSVKKSKANLCRCLLEARFNLQKKKEMVRIATESLKKFHESEIDIDGTGRCWLSHGDASITNVLYDPETKLAIWFDFDLRHDFRCDANQRHADDLRSLLFSAVHLFDEDSIEDWIQSQRTSYPNDKVWAALANQLSSRWFAIDVFHHSQMVRVRKKCGLTAKKIKQLDCKLVKAILDFAQHDTK